MSGLLGVWTAWCLVSYLSVSQNSFRMSVRVNGEGVAHPARDNRVGGLVDMTKDSIETQSRADPCCLQPLSLCFGSPAGGIPCQPLALLAFSPSMNPRTQGYSIQSRLSGASGDHAGRYRSKASPFSSLEEFAFSGKFTHKENERR